MNTKGITVIVASLQLASLTLLGQVNLLTNGHFEVGEKTPVGWTLAKKGGDWLRTEGVDGGACIAINGSGEDDNAWLSDRWSSSLIVSTGSLFGALVRQAVGYSQRTVVRERGCRRAEYDVAAHEHVCVDA